jgi:hypothetical protein
MLGSQMRLPLGLALLTAAAAFIGQPGAARADEPDVVRPGMYQGQWHGDKVLFIIEEVSGDGTFSGVVHFPKTSRFPDALFVFSGEIGRHRAITIKRDPNNDPQVSKAGEPRREKGALIWEGETTGDDLDKPYPFELRIPLPK